MNSKETLFALLSLDIDQSRNAANEIIYSNNSTLTEYYIPYLDKINIAISKIPAPTTRYVRDPRHSIWLAKKILNTVAQGKCRCSEYLSSDLLLPEELEKHNLVTIKIKEDIPWTPAYECECTDCKQMYRVVENHNYHYPWSRWRKI